MAGGTDASASKSNKSESTYSPTVRVSPLHTVDLQQRTARTFVELCESLSLLHSWPPPLSLPPPLSQFAFVYIFNLIIGVGALSLPKAFSESGLVLGTILICLLCFVSFMTATFMVEAMAAANAYFKMERLSGSRASAGLNVESYKVTSGDGRLDSASWKESKGNSVRCRRV